MFVFLYLDSNIFDPINFYQLVDTCLRVELLLISFLVTKCIVSQEGEGNEDLFNPLHIYTKLPLFDMTIKRHWKRASRSLIRLRFENSKTHMSYNHVMFKVAFWIEIIKMEKAPSLYTQSTRCASCKLLSEEEDPMVKQAISKVFSMQRHNCRAVLVVPRTCFPCCTQRSAKLLYNIMQ